MSSVGEQKFLNNIELVNMLFTNENVRNDLLSKYETMSIALDKNKGIERDDSKAIIDSNIETFISASNDIVVSAILSTASSEELEKQFPSLNKLKSNIKHTIASKGLQSNANDVIQQRFASLLGGVEAIPKEISAQDLTNALMLFGLSDAEDTEENDEELIIDDIDLDDIEWGESETDNENTEEVLVDEDETFSEEDIMSEEPVTVEEPVTIEEPVVEEDTIPDDKKDIIEKLRNSTLSGQVTSRIKDLCGVLRSLYESGFNSFPQVGILGNNKDGASLIKLYTGDSKTVETTLVDAGSSFDYKIAQAIMSVVPELSSYATTAEGETVPEIYGMIESSKVCHKMQLQFQSCNISYSSGSRTSIRTWVTQTQLKESGLNNFDEWNKVKNNNKNKLSKYKYASSWYKWCISNIMYEAIASDILKRNEAGENIKLEKPLGSDTYVVPGFYNDYATNIINSIDKNFRNVIVVSERNKDKDSGALVSTEVRISCGKQLDAQKIMESLNATLNTGVSSSIKIKQLSRESLEKNNVLIIKIIFDEENENKADLFAYEITDKLLESGGAPSWSHALLGKKDDGTYFYWDEFMDDQKAMPEKRCYTIYAASRSGKGVMTSTLIASALCDGKQVFYTDGKPENGPCLGQIAWDRGQEAYIFDGQASGKVPFDGYMENYTNGMRNPLEVASYMEKQDCPKELFTNSAFFNDATQRQFLGVMRYLKSMYLLADIIEGRSDLKYDTSQWQVWIFDEVSNMAENELEVRKILAKYLRVKTGRPEPKTDKDSPDIANAKLAAFDFSAKNFHEMIDPKSDKYDPGLAYVYKWNTWTNAILPKISKAATISLGKANLNIIFIFQEAKWLKESKGKVTTLGRVVSSLKSTKIVGRGALGNGLGEYGDAECVKSDWYSETVNQENKGYWAISSGADLRSAAVTVFKPYKVWTIPLKDGKLRNLELEPISEDESKKYVKGYIEYITNKLGIDAASILTSAYTYADQVVQQAGYASSIKEFLYDCSNFAITEVDASYANLYNSLRDNEYDENGNRIQVTDSNKSMTSFNIPDGLSEDILNESVKAEQYMGENTDKNTNDAVNGMVSNSGSELANNLGNSLNLGNNSELTNNLNSSLNLSGNAPALKLMQTSKLVNLIQSGKITPDYLEDYFNKYVVIPMSRGFNLKDRASEVTGGGLAQAVIAYSILHVLGNLDSSYVDRALSNASQSLQASGKSLLSAKIYNGFAGMYSANRLKYDTKPSDSLLREIVNSLSASEQRPEPINNMGVNSSGENSFDNMNNFEPVRTTENLGNDTYEASDFWDNPVESVNNTRYSAEERGFNGQTAKEVDMDDSGDSIWNIDNDGQLTLDNIRYTTDSIRPPVGTDLIPGLSFLNKIRKNAYESRTGTSYMMHRYWKHVLNEASKKVKGDNLRVTQFELRYPSIIVNGIMIPLDRVLGGDEYIELEDIFNIEETFKKFPNIKKFSIDRSGVPAMLNEYGSDPKEIWQLFLQHPKLQLLVINNNGVSEFPRSGFAQVAAQLGRELKEESAIKALETQMAMKNPRLSSEPGAMYRASQHLIGKASVDYFKKGHDIAMSSEDKKVRKWLGATAMGIGAVMVGGLLGVPQFFKNLGNRR